MPPLSPAQLATLRAVLDRVTPADDFPGALLAGTDNYIVGQLGGDCAAEADYVRHGLAQLDLEAAARHGARCTFTELTAMQQDTLLAALEAARPATVWPHGVAPAAFFNRLIDLTHEGFYADPGNGGNRDGVSWRMLGYDPRTTP